MLQITSTVWNAPDAVRRCIESVPQQAFRQWQHTVWCLDEPTAREAREATAGEPRITVRVRRRAPALEILVPFWRSLPPADPVVWLDGDDWLAGPMALGTVAHAHACGAWVTYGSYQHPDGSRGFTRAVPIAGQRAAPWAATHLRTFRAGLTRRLRDDHLRCADGSYAGAASDCRVMWAVLEMAGETRSRFLSDVLCVYNVAHSTWHQPGGRELELAEEARCRVMAPYAELAELPG